MSEGPRSGRWGPGRAVPRGLRPRLILSFVLVALITGATTVLLTYLSLVFLPTEGMSRARPPSPGC